MESLNALLQGMGLMHLGAGQAIMLLVSLLLLWLAIAKKFEPLLLLPIGFGGLLSNIPEAGMALTALESLLAHHDAGQLAVIAAKLNCAPDVHAIKEALALALPSVQNQMENLAVDMGYTPGVLALFYKVAIGSGVAPLVIFMGVGAMTDFGPLLANPRTLLLGRRHSSASSPPYWGADAELLRPDCLHPAAGGGHRHYRRRGRPDGDLSVGQAGTGAAGGHCGGGLLVYGAGAVNPAADYARADQRERAQNPHGAAAHGE